MIKFADISSQGTTGFKVVLLWLFSLQIMYHEVKGDHISFGFCIGPLGISINLHLFSNLLP